jgi:hypothetical protein
MPPRQILKQAQSEVRSGKDRQAVFDAYGGQIKNPAHLAAAIASVVRPEHRQRHGGLNTLLAGLLFTAAGLKALTALVVFSRQSIFIGLGAVLLGILVPIAMAIGVLRFEGQVYGLLILICGVNLLNTLMKVGELGAWVLVDAVFLTAIMALAWTLKNKLFPSLGFLKAKKDASGKYSL